MRIVESAAIGCVDAGCVSYIECLARREPSVFATFAYVWISCLDSNRALSVGSGPFATIGQFGGQLTMREDGKVVVSSQSIIQAAVDARFFNGFDEIWCFREPPPPELPDTLYIASDKWLESPDYRAHGGAESLYEVHEWMNRSGAVLGLGDGAWLNYVTTDVQCAHSIEQAFT